ncbi:hypothetical protein A4X03_0g8815, partial [Tilletia caries]
PFYSHYRRTSAIRNQTYTLETKHQKPQRRSWPRFLLQLSLLLYLLCLFLLGILYLKGKRTRHDGLRDRRGGGGGGGVDGSSVDAPPPSQPQPQPPIRRRGPPAPSTWGEPPSSTSTSSFRDRDRDRPPPQERGLERDLSVEDIDAIRAQQRYGRDVLPGTALEPRGPGRAVGPGAPGAVGAGAGPQPRGGWADSPRGRGTSSSWVGSAGGGGGGPSVHHYSDDARVPRQAEVRLLPNSTAVAGRVHLPPPAQEDRAHHLSASADGAPSHPRLPP